MPDQETDQERHNANALQHLIDETLLQSSSQHITGVFNDLRDKACQRSLEWQPAVVLEYWWDLARMGVIAFPGQTSSPPPAEIPSFLLTSRGRALLARGEHSPHNPQRYYRSIEQRIKTPDSVVMTYLNEAVGAWAAGLYRSSTVMLGCACERLILLLAEAISSAAIPPWSGKLKKNLAKSVDSPVGISQIFGDVRSALLARAADDRKLPGALADALDRKLTPIFERARGLRNGAGHPTAIEIYANDAEASLLLFPGFYFLTSDLIANVLELGNEDR